MFTDVDVFNSLAQQETIVYRTELIFAHFFFKIAFVLLVAACVYAKPKPDIVAYSAPLVASPYAASSAVVSRELKLTEICAIECWIVDWFLCIICSGEFHGNTAPYVSAYSYSPYVAAYSAPYSAPYSAAYSAPYVASPYSAYASTVYL